MIETILNTQKYRLLWYLPLLLSPIFWPWLMIILALLVGVTQGFLTYLQGVRPDKVLDVAKNPKIIGASLYIIMFIVVILSIGTLIWFTFSSFPAENMETYLSMKYIVIGILWTLLIEAICITVCTKYALRHLPESTEENTKKE